MEGLLVVRMQVGAGFSRSCEGRFSSFGEETVFAEEYEPAASLTLKCPQHCTTVDAIYVHNACQS